MKIDNCFLCQRMFYELLSSCFHFNVIFVYVRGFPETGIHAITFRTEKIITLTSMPASNPWFAQYEFDTRQFFDRTCRRSTRETSPMSTNRNANKKQCDTVAYKKKPLLILNLVTLDTAQFPQGWIPYTCHQTEFCVSDLYITSVLRQWTLLLYTAFKCRVCHNNFVHQQNCAYWKHRLSEEAKFMPQQNTRSKKHVQVVQKLLALSIQLGRFFPMAAVQQFHAVYVRQSVQRFVNIVWFGS